MYRIHHVVTVSDFVSTLGLGKSAAGDSSGLGSNILVQFEPIPKYRRSKRSAAVQDWYNVLNLNALVLTSSYTCCMSLVLYFRKRKRTYALKLRCSIFFVS